MSARFPRRVFAKPMVVTVAAASLGACIVATQPTGTTQPRVINTGDGSGSGSGSATGSDAPPTIMTNPPMPTPPVPTPPPPATRPVADRDYKWGVFKNNDGTCVAHISVTCPTAKPGMPVPTCNPPPPMPTECPATLAVGQSVEVVQFKGTIVCQVMPAPVTCPPKVMCNPPPPQQVPCPQ